MSDAFLFMKYYVFIAIVFCVGCKQRFYKNASGSMEGTLMRGERFAVILSDKFERNDIVVFDHFGPDYSAGPPYENASLPLHWEKRVFRMVAYSGDSLEIRNGDVYVNGRQIPVPPKSMMLYEVLSREPIKDFEEMDPSMLQVSQHGDSIRYEVYLMAEQVPYYKQIGSVISIGKAVDRYKPADTAFARNSASDSWTPDNYGPVRIPLPGEVLDIDEGSFKMYHNIPGVEMGKYRLKEKLYFMLGDNRHFAEDSRYIGLIPHSKMNGVVK